MKPLPWTDAENYRWKNAPHGYASNHGDDFGVFEIPFLSYDLHVLVSSGNEEYPWEHVSVSMPKRCPTWDMMCRVKDLFWTEDELVIQYHPPKSEHVNCHPYCLHLWKPTKAIVPAPPSILVGPDQFKGIK